MNDMFGTKIHMTYILGSKDETIIFVIKNERIIFADKNDSHTPYWMIEL